MVTFFSILSMLLGAGLLYFGLKWYGTSLALAFFIPIFMVLAQLGWLGTIPLIILLVVSGVIFLFARPLTYFVSWGLIASVVILLFLLVGIKPGANVFFSVIPQLSAAVIVWFIRTHLRALNIGMAGGSSIALGINSFVFGNIKLQNFTESIFGMGIIILLFMVGGVVFQYLYVIPRQESIDSLEDTQDLNENAG